MAPAMSGAFFLLVANECVFSTIGLKSTNNITHDMPFI